MPAKAPSQVPIEPPSGDTPGGWQWLGPGPVLAAIGAGLLLWLAGGAVLLISAGILVAIALDGLSTVLARWTRLKRGWALLIVLAVFGLLITGFAFQVAPELAEQFDRLWTQLAEISELVKQVLEGYVWGRRLLGGGGPVNDTARELAGQVAWATLTTLVVIADAVIILVIGIFLAANPGLYRTGLVRLVPKRRRERARQILAAIGIALRWWLLGQLVSMVTLGIVTSVALWLLEVPLWLPLGVLTGVLTFIPFLGPILAGVPVIMISLVQGLDTALSVLAVYVTIQSFEGYWLTPMVQQRAVRLPPALLIAMQVLLGVLLGLPGLALAAPLTAVGMVMVNLLYIEDVLGDRPETG